ncbi:uncharacterized protein K452DRAFT_6742 [Aplosporella prunicola CBS 121167]|uniref:Uncharacterized protein n=1 Tax=Aplosporella prunicola CBS 121167 TaxID=1176127 RepID=A0A6A6BU86_9PEZI|nr:uncharacterized protein K452DRAFT_6742 [Aplosporella prunicola CBS 121167]KAF2147388.1 hypothetical protein K452DRAFT_6742 [Aplosporella prunicola CBS 121167]
MRSACSTPLLEIREAQVLCCASLSAVPPFAVVLIATLPESMFRNLLFSPGRLWTFRLSSVTQLTPSSSARLKIFQRGPTVAVHRTMPWAAAGSWALLDKRRVERGGCGARNLGRKRKASLEQASI